MSNPVQIILNSRNFIQRVVPTPGGSNTDFFSGRDKEFINHKQNLISSIDSIVQSSPDDGLIYANVELQVNGWAKSHRPVNKIFNDKNIESITAGNELGNIIIGTTKEKLNEISSIISKAPNHNSIEIDKKTGNPKEKVTPLRSEVGVIRSLRLYDKSDKRSFSAQQAMEWLCSQDVGSVYYIETFISSKNYTLLEESELQNCFHKIKEKLLMLEVINLDLDLEIDSLIFIIKFKNNNDLRNQSIHVELLDILDNSSIVRMVYLPPVIQSLESTNLGSSSLSTFAPEEGKSYAVVGVIDTGIADNDVLRPWVAGGIEFIQDDLQQERNHGTFIAGLLAHATQINNDKFIKEAPCKIFDIDLFPTFSFEEFYSNGFIDFLKQLDDYLPEVKAKGIKILNMSLNLVSCVNDQSYSLYADFLDKMSKKHGVIFVLSAGNLQPKLARDEWPVDKVDALKQLAEYPYQGEDRIYIPSESVLSVTVGSVDPELTSDQFFPSRFSRRGPGVSFAQKPDLVHVGGSMIQPHHLKSFSPNGSITSGCGTSYSAPLVAKTLANIDHLIEGDCKLETLKALLIHNAEKPDWTQIRELKAISNDFVGYGIPKNAYESLTTADNEITMVFEGEISKNQELNFEFSWPQSLVTPSGGISGTAQVTLVYTPNIDRHNGAEFILNSLDVRLRQQTDKTNQEGEPIFKNILTNDKDYAFEKDMIQHGLKWWPVRKIQNKWTNKGRYSLCRLVVEPLARSGYEIIEPVPFTVILTISDDKKKHHIFDEMKQQLTANGVLANDIRTHVSNRLRT